MCRAENVPDKDAAAPTPAGRSQAARLPVINTGRCTGCGRCVAVCGEQLLSLEVVRWQKFSTLRDAPLCTGCSFCAAVCPFHAITMRRPAGERAAAVSADPA